MQERRDGKKLEKNHRKQRKRQVQLHNDRKEKNQQHAKKNARKLTHTQIETELKPQAYQKERGQGY